MFLDEVFVGVVNHPFSDELAGDLVVEFKGVGCHELVGNCLGVSFWDNNGEDLGGAMLFCVDVKTGF